MSPHFDATAGCSLTTPPQLLPLQNSRTPRQLHFQLVIANQQPPTIFFPFSFRVTLYPLCALRRSVFVPAKNLPLILVKFLSFLVSTFPSSPIATAVPLRKSYPCIVFLNSFLLHLVKFPSCSSLVSSIVGTAVPFHTHV